jgi:hypothetical protein
MSRLTRPTSKPWPWLVFLSDRRAQSTIEFVILIGFSLFIFLSFFIIIENNSINAQEQVTNSELRELQHLVTSEFDFAAGASPGYSRVFTLPELLGGLNYSVELIDGQEISIIYKDHETVSFLPWDVSGNISKGRNIIEKVGGTLIVTPIP